MKDKETLYANAVALLSALIGIPSFSREEQNTAALIHAFLEKVGVKAHRHKNNVWAKNKYFDSSKATILLNSHHDTVKPNSGYTRDPFKAEIIDGKLYGLGSNDAGGSIVSLMAAFLYFYEDKDLAYNLIYAATAEEEISGTDGIESILDDIYPLELAIVGEPTKMQMAVAEKGLMVLDCTAHGKAGHAAREEGINAIYLAMNDIKWFESFRFPKESEFLGQVKMSVTMVQSGTQHNVVPATCTYVVDVRIPDTYTPEEILEEISKNVKSEVVPRSTRLKPSCIPLTHPLVQAGLRLGRTTYGSPTTSDQALINASSLKMGPGDSARSHSADEFIYVEEIHEAIEIYTQMLQDVLLPEERPVEKIEHV